MNTYRIAILPGDGIGPEVTKEALKALQAVEEGISDIHFDFEEYPVGARCYLETGSDLPGLTLKACREADAILFGAAGLPDVRFPDGTEIMPQLTLRFVLDLYAGVRPIKRIEGVPPALSGKSTIDYVIVRENTEGLYASRGGGSQLGKKLAVDNMIITRRGTERVVRWAFQLARKRKGMHGSERGMVHCVDKANVLKSMAFFREVFDWVASEFPDIQTDHAYVDAMALFLVQRPERFDVLVMENMFGDILSDLAAGTIGGMGLAPSADVGNDYGLFQASHGSAPDIAGKGIANPAAQILSAAMMLDWIGDKKSDAVARKAAEVIDRAVASVLKDSRNHTADIGGKAPTEQVGDAVAEEVIKVVRSI